MRLFALLVIGLMSSSVAAAGELQKVPVESDPQVSAYVEVPRGLDCHVKIPGEPTAFCAGQNGAIYHLHTFGTMEGWVDPAQTFNRLMQQVSDTSNVRILDRYPAPEVVRARLQRDAPLLFLRGQKVSAFGFDTMDPDKNQQGVSVLVISLIPNNGAPITRIDGFGITTPSGRGGELRHWRGELRRFVNSYHYDPQRVQQLNAQTVQFESDLRMRNNAFYSSQQQIHRNNMDALDNSYNAYQRRNAASDQGQSRFVDSIHGRQQFIDPNSGQRYQADGYADYNYVNPNNPDQWVRGNDSTWDPNVNTEQGQDFQRLEEYTPGNW